MPHERPMAADDRRWQAESDAHTLARAAEIEADSKRFNAATKVAKKMAEERMKETVALEQVARAKGKG